MTAAYLTELEITRQLRLPDKIGRIAMATWKMQRSFPAPVEGMGGRRFWPAVEEWLLQYHGVGAQTIMNSVPIPLPGDKGEDFDGWRKTKAARRPKRAGPDLPPPPRPLGNVLGAAVGPDEARLSGQDRKVVAFRQHAVPAE